MRRMSFPGAGSPPQRLESVDRLRGLVMLFMALDHARDFWSATPFAPEDLSQTTPLLFATRWITHFCAPVFVFLAGTSAFLARARRGTSAAATARFLAKRGLWLIAVELTLVSWSWQFDWNGLLIAQVIWAIGWSMLVLSLLVFLPVRAVAAFGLVTIAGHDLLNGVAPGSFFGGAALWKFLHVQAPIGLRLGGEAPQLVLWIAYPIVPWIGVMAAGYAFGAVAARPEPERHAWMRRLGLGATLVFVLLRLANVYGDPRPWAAQERGWVYTALSFLNTSKYPPSLLFLAMTLGPALLVMPLLERWRSRAAEILATFGRVPFFYYVLHIPLLHLTSMLWWRWTMGQRLSFLASPDTWPAGYAPHLGRAYLVWWLTAAALYLPCRWFAGVRSRHRTWWLRYL